MSGIWVLVRGLYNLGYHNKQPLFTIDPHDVDLNKIP